MIIKSKNIIKKLENFVPRHGGDRDIFDDFRKSSKFDDFLLYIYTVKKNHRTFDDF